MGEEWAETPAGPIGVLEGDDRWTSLDPELTAKLPYKGNHVHLEIEGLFDKTWESEMAHNDLLDGRETPQQMRDFLRRRAAFFNECLMRELTGGGQ